jgi:hypothetical protein
MNTVLAIAAVIIFGIGIYNMKILIQKKRLMKRKSFFLLSFYIFAQISCVSKFKHYNSYTYSYICVGPRRFRMFFLLPVELPPLPAFLHDLNRCRMLYHALHRHSLRQTLESVHKPCRQKAD